MPGTRAEHSAGCNADGMRTCTTSRTQSRRLRAGSGQSTAAFWRSERGGGWVILYATNLAAFREDAGTPRRLAPPADVCAAMGFISSELSLQGPRKSPAASESQMHASVSSPSRMKDARLN